MLNLTLFRLFYLFKSLSLRLIESSTVEIVVSGERQRCLELGILPFLTPGSGSGFPRLRR